MVRNEKFIHENNKKLAALISDILDSMLEHTNNYIKKEGLSAFEAMNIAASITITIANYTGEMLNRGTALISKKEVVRDIQRMIDVAAERFFGEASTEERSAHEIK